MKPGSRKPAEVCEVQGCTKPAVYLRKNPKRHEWVCTYHLAKQDAKWQISPKEPRSSADKEREASENRLRSLGAVGGFVLDRELSFSEKIDKIGY